MSLEGLLLFGSHESKCELDTWPVLFVCGGDHTGSFRALLEDNGLGVHVVRERWVPDSGDRPA